MPKENLRAFATLLYLLFSIYLLFFICNTFICNTFICYAFIGILTEWSINDL